METLDTLPFVQCDATAAAAGREYGISSFVKGGVGLLTTATVDMAVAFSTGYWATWSRSGEIGEYGGYGLWKVWQCSVVRGTPAAAAAGNGTAAGEEVQTTTTTTTAKPTLVALAFNRMQTGVLCQEKMADLSFPGNYGVLNLTTIRPNRY